MKFLELPIENTEWLTSKKIRNQKLIDVFEKKQAKSEQQQAPSYRRFHHIGQNSLKKFLNQATYIKNWELQDFDTKRRSKNQIQETIHLSDDDDVIDVV